MGSYQVIDYRTKNLEKYKFLEEVSLFSPDYSNDDMNARAVQGKIISDEINLCRKLAWGPANYITPIR